MSQPACGPYTDGYTEGSVEGPLLSDKESLVRYKDQDCLTERPRRERTREEISDYVLAMLGAPMVRVELDRQQLSIAVDEALKRFEEGCGKSEYKWFYFRTIPGVSRYEFKCDIGLIRDVCFASDDMCLGTQVAAQVGMEGNMIPFAGTALAAAGMGSLQAISSGGYPRSSGPMHINVGEWHLMQSYQELFLRLSSSEPTWELGNNNSIILSPVPRGARTVGVHFLQRKKDWSDANRWMKDCALALAKEMLGRVRSKYDRYVSPGGGVSLDGQALIQEAQARLDKLDEELVGKYSVDMMLPYVG